MNALLSFVSAAFWGLVVLSILVFVHEGGHYLAAHACGMRATEFFLGMPCHIKLSRKSKKRGTEFGVTPLLLGGYTRICGMEGAEDELLAPCLALVQERGRVSAADVATELGIDIERSRELLATLCDWASIEPYYDSERGEREGQRDYPETFETVRRDGQLLTEFDRGHDFTKPETTEAGSPRPIEGSADDFLKAERSRTFLGKGFLKRTVTLLAGPLVNILLSILIVTSGLCLVGTNVAKNTNIIGEVTEGGYADEAGVRPGDAIVAVDGRSVSDWKSLVATLREVLSEGRSFTLTVERDGRQIPLAVDIPEGATGAKLGITAQTENVKLSLLESAGVALGYGKAVVQFALRLLMPQHTMEVLQGTSSVVGISAMASEAASQGAYPLILFLAFVSMSLGIMNLLPIPPLDGGKILIEVIQLVIRRPLSLRVQTIMSYIGIAFFVFIFVFALRNDIVNIVMG